MGILADLNDRLARARAHGSRDSTNSVSAPLYSRRRSFLDANERSFYDCLVGVIGTRLPLFCKVRLADLVEPPSEEARSGHWVRAQRVSVDFLVVTASTMSPVLAIVMDTPRENQRRRVQGPDVVDDVLGDVGIPLLRVRVKESYDPQELSSSIRRALSASQVHGSTTATEEPEEAGETPGRPSETLQRHLPTFTRWTSGLRMSVKTTRDG